MSPWLCSLVAHRWIHGVSHRLAPPWRPGGPPPALPGHRPRAATARDASARAALGTGGQDRAAAPAGPRAVSGRVRHAGRYRAGTGRARLAHQDGLHGAPQPHHPPAWGSRRSTRHAPLHRCGGPTPAAHLVSCVLSLLCATRLLTPAGTAVCTHPWPRLGHAVAAPDARQGRGPAGARLDAARGAAVPRAPVAAARAGVRTPGGVGHSQGRGSEPARGAHTAGFKGLTRGARAAGRP